MSRTAEEADQRIMLSRRTLAGWMQGGAGGQPEDLLRMVREEIGILEGLVEEHPGKAIKLARLVNEWRSFQASLKKRAH